MRCGAARRPGLLGKPQGLVGCGAVAHPGKARAGQTLSGLLSFPKHPGKGKVSYVKLCVAKSAFILWEKYDLSPLQLEQPRRSTRGRRPPSHCAAHCSAPRSAARAPQPSFRPRYCSYAFKDNLFLRITNNSLPQCRLHGTEIPAVRHTGHRDRGARCLGTTCRLSPTARPPATRTDGGSRRLSGSVPLTTCPHPLATGTLISCP